MKKTLFTVFLSILGVVAMAQYPVVPIDSVQFINPTRLSQIKFNTSGQDGTLSDYAEHKSTLKYGDTIIVEGVVTFDPASYGLSFNRRSALIQDTSNRPWCGVEIIADTAALSPRPTKAALEAASQFAQNMKKGRKVRVTAFIGDFQGNTQLYLLPIPITVISLSNTITPQVVALEDIMKNNSGSQEPQFVTGEKWEGVYIEIKDVTIENVSPSGLRWFWSVNDGKGNVLSIRDYSGYYRNDDLDFDVNTPRNFTPPVVGAKLPYIRGVVTESGTAGSKQYYIAPLYPDDVPLPLAEPPKVADIKRNPAIVTPTTSPTISATITDNGSVASAVLYYAVGYNNTTFTTVNMTASGSKYSAAIPAQSAGSIVKFYIKATDNEGNYINSPDSLALNSAYKVVNSISSIKDIQETPYNNGGSMFVNDTLKGINVSGIVVSTNSANDLGLITLQSSGAAEWSAIFVRPTLGDGTSDWKRGDSVIITEAIVTERFNQGSDPFGRVSNSFGTTFLENVKFVYGGRCKTIPKITNLTIDSLLSPTFNKEPYESAMISFSNVTVINKNPDDPSNFGEFAVNTDANALVGLRGENFSNDLGFTFNTDSLTLKETLSVFQGPLVLTFGNWKIFPRNRTDVGKAGDLIAPYITKIGADTIFIPRGTNYTDPGAMACDDVDGDISANVVINTANVNTNVSGIYTVTLNVSDAANNVAVPATRTVVVGPGVGVQEIGKTISMSLYPVPVSNTLNVSLNSNYTDVATVSLMDVTGKIILSQAINFEAGENTVTIPTAQLASGIYFCNLNSKAFNTTQKFVVVK